MDQLPARKSWIDYAKAIGIILVVYGHIARGIYSAGIEMPTRLYELADSIIYSFHMPLFFFLSGLCFYSSFCRRGGIKLINTKVDTVLYPYIIWSIIQGLIEASLASYTNGSVSYSEVFSLLWQPRAQFWFLYALFIVSCLAAILFSLLSQRATGTIFVLAAFAYVYPLLLTDGLVFRFISNNFVFFMFGIIFSLHIKIDWISNLPAVSLLACGFALCQFIFHCILGSDYLDKGIASLLLALISILFVISLSAWAASKPSKLLMLIGSSSMAIYLMHILAGSGIRVFLTAFMGTDSAVVHLVTGCLVALFAPILVLLVIRRLKIPYIFSAPLSKTVMLTYNSIGRRTG